MRDFLSSFFNKIITRNCFNRKVKKEERDPALALDQGYNLFKGESCPSKDAMLDLIFEAIILAEEQ